MLHYEEVCEYCFYSHVLPLIDFTLVLVARCSLHITVWKQLSSSTSPAAANEAQVVESGHLVLDGGRGVTELG